MKKCLYFVSSFMLLILSSCETDSSGEIHLSSLGWLIVVGVVVFFVWAIISTNRRKSETAQEMVLKGMDFSDFVEMGTYAGGHPNLNETIDKIYCRKEDRNLKFYTIPIWEISMPETVSSADIPLDTIADITIEDATSIEKKITVGRIFLVGIFALGWRKKKKNEMAFLVIEWKKGRFEHSTTFSFEGKDAFQRANTSRNRLISLCENS